MRCRASGTGTLADVETGRTVREMDRVEMYGLGAPASVSSDGRWFADRTGGKLAIVDLDSGAVWPLDIRSGSDQVTRFVGLAGTAIAS